MTQIGGCNQQALLMMAILGFASRLHDFFPKSQLNVPESEFRDYSLKTDVTSFNKAKSKWLRGK